MSNRTTALGGAGLALLADGYINQTNPAALARINNTRFEGDFQFRGYSMDDGTSQLFLSSGNVQGASIALPIYSDYAMVMGIGIRPFSTVAYTIKASETMNGRETWRTFEGSGGLTNVQAGLSFAPAQDVYLGFSAHYLFGAMRHKQTLDFGTTSYYGSKAERVIAADGFALTFGGIYNGIDKALGWSETRSTNVAVTLFTGSTLSATDSTTLKFVTGTDTVYGNSWDGLTIPFGIGLGVASAFKERMIAVADIQLQFWGSYTDPTMTVTPTRNSIRLGGGVEFLGAHGPTETYFSQISYRLGAFVNLSYLKINNQSINEFFGTGGFSLPISSAGGEAKINIALEVGIRGTTSSSLQRDVITRLTASLSASELFWFIPPEIE
jgi:hypothetical protein